MRTCNTWTLCKDQAILTLVSGTCKTPNSRIHAKTNSWHLWLTYFWYILFLFASIRAADKTSLILTISVYNSAEINENITSILINELVYWLITVALLWGSNNNLLNCIKEAESRCRYHIWHLTTYSPFGIYLVLFCLHTCLYLKVYNCLCTFRVDKMHTGWDIDGSKLMHESVRRVNLTCTKIQCKCISFCY